MPSFKVIGTAEILGHQPGETFDANLDPEQEAFLTAIGGIERTSSAEAPVEPNIVPDPPVVEVPAPKPEPKPKRPLDPRP